MKVYSKCRRGRIDTCFLAFWARSCCTCRLCTVPNWGYQDSGRRLVWYVYYYHNAAIHYYVRTRPNKLMWFDENIYPQSYFSSFLQPLFASVFLFPFRKTFILMTKVPLTLKDWKTVLLWASPILIVDEILKSIGRKRLITPNDINNQGATTKNR